MNPLEFLEEVQCAYMMNTFGEMEGAVEMGFVEGIEILMLKRKSNKSDLARRLGDSPQNLGKKFKRETFKDEDIKQIATVLNCNFTYIFTDKDTGEEIHLEML